jgi:hypothetical protein
MRLESIFNKEGNFIHHIDPYRCDDNDVLYKELFDEDGCSTREDEARKFIIKYNCSPFSDVVRYYYSHYFDCACKGNYTARYMWR